MLAPRASNAFVCTRCELQLARRRLPAHFPRPSRATFSASVRLRDGADELETQLDTPPTSIKITKEIQQLNRLKKRKGKLIRETSARLDGIKTLGDDADILVLREIDKKKDDGPVIEPISAEAVAVPDILASLQQERSALTPEEIQDRLESLRPKIDAAPDEPLYVSLKVFVKLMRNLSEGFTHQQLSKFYSTSKNVAQAAYPKEVLASLKGLQATAKRPFTRTNWQPETTPLAHRLPGADISTKSQNHARLVSKQLLVDRIIRDLWKLVPLEEVEALGELELSLKPWQVVMLTAGEDETILDKISSVRKAKVEIYRQHSVLRITADKTTAEYVANDIEEALQNIAAKKLQLKPWIDSLEPSKVPEDKQLAALFSTEDFQMVTSASRVSIQRMDNKNTLVLRGLDEGAVAEAERTLLRLLPLREIAIRTVDDQGLGDSAQLLSTPFDAKSLDHKHREASLGRWLSPVPRQARMEGLKDDSESNAELDFAETSSARQDRVATIVENFRWSATAEISTAKKFGPWKAQPQFTMSATFGQALYPLGDTTSSSTPTLQKSASSQPLFTPSVPGMTTLFSSAQTHTPSGPFRFDTLPHTPTLVYEFIPAPEQQRVGASQTLPGLRIEMRTPGTETEATFHKMYIYIHEHFHTVLLPEGAADLQLQRVFRVGIRGNHGVGAIDEWISAVKANIASGERISAPDLTIDIPNWTIAGQSRSAGGMQTVKYLFSGVRYRQAVSGTFQGTPVSYNTNQSNKLSSQGGSLNMHYESSAQNVQAPSDGEDKVALFVDKCLMFAERITQAASNTQPIAKLGRLRGPDRGRNPRRHEETGATDKEKTAVDSTGVDAPLATENDFAAGSIAVDGPAVTIDTAGAAKEQHQEQSQSVDEVAAFETKLSAIETEAVQATAEHKSVAGEEGTSPPPEKDDDIASSSERTAPTNDHAEMEQKDSGSKAQT